MTLPSLTHAELRALPPVIDLETAGRALGLKRSTTYDLAKRDELPVRTLRLGRARRVVSAELLKVLGVAPEGEGCSSSASAVPEADEASAIAPA